MEASPISRRDWLKIVPATAAALAELHSQAGANPGPAGKMRFTCMVTFEDWAEGAGTWGDVGIYYVLRRIQDAGFHRVFWRTSGSGQASYPTKVATPISMWQPYDPAKFPEHLEYLDRQAHRRFSSMCCYGSNPHFNRQVLDFSNFDSAGIARDLCRKIGLRFWLWHEHAEDHGAIGQIGRMGLRHPEWFTVNRDGKRSHCRFSFALPAAVEYRLAWVRELLEYEPDGVYFDFTKSMESTPGAGCTPHFDHDGVWYCTYEAGAVEQFRRQIGRDPFCIPNNDAEWVNFRAAYLTGFLRRVRELQRADYPRVQIGLFGCSLGRAGLAAGDKVIPLADPLRAYLEDHQTWTREGLLDEFVNAYAIHGELTGAARAKATIADSRARVHAPCRYLGPQLEVYSLKEEKSIRDSVEAAATSGCEEVVFFESTPIQWNGTWDAVYRVIKDYAA
jgi:uncharacterized lipoprotein YddW (UPF0748 family)